jgi:competence protein ComEC
MMNGFIISINNLPFTLTTGLKLSFEEMLLIYILIFFMVIWIFQKNKNVLIFALGTCCCLCIINSYYNIQAKYQQQLVVYNTPRHKAIDLVLGNRCLFIGDSILANDVSLQNILLQPSRNEYRIQQSRQLERAPAIMFMTGNKRILVVDDHMQFSFLTLKADVIIISGKTTITLLQQVAGCKLIIFDSTHSNWEIEKWKAACSKAGIEFYAVAENGAFIFNLN